MALRAVLALYAATLAPWTAGLARAQAATESAATATASVVAPAYCPAPDSLGARLTFFDVGQGDAILLETGDRQFILVDGGPNSAAALQMLRVRGVERLAFVVASHNHLDHIGGLPAVLRQLPVAAFMENGLAAPSAVYRRLDAAVTASGARRTAPGRQRLSFGPTDVQVLSMPADLFTQNDRSIGLLIVHGEFRALLTGDGEIKAMESWLQNDSIPRVTVVKAGHHGSINGTTPQWVAQTSPALVVISVGARNRYGHPAPGVIAWWAAPDRMVLRTDQDGEVDVRGCRDGSVRWVARAR